MTLLEIFVDRNVFGFKLCINITLICFQFPVITKNLMNYFVVIVNRFKVTKKHSKIILTFVINLLFSLTRSPVALTKSNNEISTNLPDQFSNHSIPTTFDIGIFSTILSIFNYPQFICKKLKRQIFFLLIELKFNLL